jgi:hypothetical protein
MADTKTIIEQAYSAFNIDGALALMAQDVSWPKASEGGKIIGKEESSECLRPGDTCKPKTHSFTAIQRRGAGRARMFTSKINGRVSNVSTVSTDLLTCPRRLRIPRDARDRPRESGGKPARQLW